MKTIRFNAPPHHVLEVGERKVIGGAELDVPDKVADELITAPYADIELVSESLVSRTREQLNELAKQAGVEDPESLPNKEAVIAAIEEPEAAGEGRNDDKEEG